MPRGAGCAAGSRAVPRPASGLGPRACRSVSQTVLVDASHRTDTASGTPTPLSRPPLNFGSSTSSVAKPAPRRHPSPSFRLRRAVGRRESEIFQELYRQLKIAKRQILGRNLPRLSSRGCTTLPASGATVGDITQGVLNTPEKTQKVGAGCTSSRLLKSPGCSRSPAAPSPGCSHHRLQALQPPRRDKIDASASQRCGARQHH